MKQLFMRSINLIALILLFFVFKANTQVVSVFSTTKDMNLPGGITFDRNNNLNVASYGQGYYTVSSNGTVSTPFFPLTLSNSLVSLANGDIYSSGHWTIFKNNNTHPMIASGFNSATGITADASGNLFIVDSFLSQIFKLPPPYTGLGSSSALYRFLFCTIARPHSITVGPDGNFYVSCYDDIIRKVSPDGLTITVFATGLSAPREMAFDNFGNLFVANWGNNTICEIPPSGNTVYTIIQSTAGLIKPYGICFDATGNLYVSNQGNSNNTGFISKITLSPTTLSNFSIPSRTYSTTNFLITPPNSTNNGGIITYTSSNTSIAQIIHVNNNGIISDSIRMVGVGTCNITARQAAYQGNAGGAISTSLTINAVTPSLSNFSFPVLTSPSADYTITPPTSNSNAAFTYSSSNTAVATIVGNNSIHIIGVGKSVITATQVINGIWGSATIRADLNVTLNPYPQVTRFANSLTQPQEITFQSDFSNLYVASYGQGLYRVNPNGNVYPPSNPGVNANGITSLSNVLYLTNGTNLLKPTNANPSFITGFSNITGITKDTSGNLYVADNVASKIFKITPPSTTYTAFGNVTGPVSIARGPDGNFYISCTDNTIKKMSSDGSIVSNFVSYGLSNPKGLAFDASGNLFVANSGNNTISAITPNGVVSTFIPSTASLSAPYGLCFDAASNLYVSNQNTINNGNQGYISKINSSINTLSNFNIPNRPYSTTNFLIPKPTSNSIGAFTYTSSNPAVARIIHVNINGISKDSIQMMAVGTCTITATQAPCLYNNGRVISEYGSASITTQLTISSTVTTLSNFSIPTLTSDIRKFKITPPTSNSNGAFTYTSNNLTVATISNDTIIINAVGSATITASQAASGFCTSSSITATLNIVRPTANTQITPYSRDSSMIIPGGITFDNNDTLYVASYGGGYYKISPNGSVSTALAPTTVDGTKSNSVASVGGSIYSASSWYFYLDTVGHPLIAGGFNNATGNAADQFLNLYIADNGYPPNGAIFKFPPTFKGLNGSTIASYFLCYISNPRSITVGPDGNFYVSCDNNTIKKVTPDGRTITDFASGLSTPREMAFDKIGNLYVANWGNNTISRITPSGAVSTFIPATAGLSKPYGLCFDASDNLLVSNQTTVTNRGFIVKINMHPTFNIPDHLFSKTPFIIPPPHTLSTAPFTYTSSDITVAKIINGNYIQMVSLGTCTITATKAGVDGFGDATISTTFTVLQNSTALSNFKLPVKYYSTTPFVINPPVNHNNGNNGPFVYTSNDPTIATIKNPDSIQMINVGTCIITAIQGQYGSYSPDTTFLELTIKPIPTTLGGFIIPTKTFNSTPFQINNPVSSRTGSFTYTSSDETVARIIGNASIQMIGLGTCTITATQTAITGYEMASISTQFTINGMKDTLRNFYIPAQVLGSVSQFQITPPISNSDGSFSYTSSNPAVATISGGNYINIVGAGVTTITATQASSGTWASDSIDASFIVTTTAVLGNFSIPSMTYDSVPFLMITPPTSNSNGKFTYTSSNTAVATIIGSVIKVVGIGTTTITANQAATNIYNGATASTTFTIKPIPPTIRAFNIPAQNFYGSPSTFTLTPPISTSNGIFTYTSDNTNIAICNGSTISIVGYGSCTITATQAADNRYYASGSITANLTVNNIAAGVGVTNFNYSLGLNNSVMSVATPEDGNFGTGDFTVMTYFETNNPNKQCIISDFPRNFVPDNTNADYFSSWQLSINGGFPTFLYYPKFDFCDPRQGCSNVNYLHAAFSLNPLAIKSISDSSKNYADGVWHHVAVSRRNGIMTMYIDGVSVGNRNTTTADNSEINPPYINPHTGSSTISEVLIGTGIDYTNLSSVSVVFPNSSTTSNLSFNQIYYVGLVDETSIWKRALTQCEIVSSLKPGFLNNGLGFDKSNIVVYYNYDYFDGSSYLDSSGKTSTNNDSLKIILGTRTNPGGVTYPANSNSPVIGSIGNAHTVATPLQRTPDYITNIGNTTITNTSYTWSDSTVGGNWTQLSGKTDTRLDITTIAPTENTWFQRTATFNGCTLGTSNTVEIIVAQPALSGQYGVRNGDITGFVYAKDSATGIAGDTLLAYMSINSTVNGKSYEYIDTAITASDGSYQFNVAPRLPLFYGDNKNPSNPDQQSVSFTVYPSNINQGHLYTSLAKTATLSIYNSTATKVNFVDTSTLIVNGLVVERCANCILGKDSVGVDSVKMTAVSTSNSGLGLKEIDSIYTYNDAQKGNGTYNLTIIKPGTFKVTPKYKNHHFSLESRDLTVSNSLSSISFLDTTTKILSGYVSAGCKSFIGRFRLTFGDVLRDTGRNILSVGEHLQATTTTNDKGFYSITLPAREYQVTNVEINGDFRDTTITDQTKAADPTLVLYYFNVTLSKDSLTKSIDTANATLNLFFPRPPQIAVVGLYDPIETAKNIGTCRSHANDYIWKKGDTMPFTIQVYQGPPSLNCPVDTGSIQLVTDFNGLAGAYSTIPLTISNGKVDTFLVAGPPSTTVSPYAKWFDVTYTDLAGNSANYNSGSNLIVLGISKQEGASVFTTVSPAQVPILILHDPPGDQSFSSWSTNSTVTQTTDMTVTGNGGVTGTMVLSSGIEEQVGAIISTKVVAGVRFTDIISASGGGGTHISSEITNVTSHEIQTSASTTAVGSMYDVIYGKAFNFLYTVGNKIYFDDHCNLAIKPVVVFAPKSDSTTYLYTVNYIVNSMLPQMQTWYQDTTGSNHDSAYWGSQIRQWQQIINNNYDNIKKSKDSLNLSFSNNTSQTHSWTSSSTQTNNIVYHAELSNDFIVDFEAFVSKSGISHSIDINMSAETDGEKGTTTTDDKTMSFTLNDDNGNVNDFINVNVATDPVYGTPIFRTLAGGTSCPHEENTVAIDSCVLVYDTRHPKVKYSGDSALVYIVLSNQSFLQGSGNQEEYHVSLNSTTNPDAAFVSIGGNSPGLPAVYKLGFNESVTVPILIVRNPLTGVFNYDNLEIDAVDDCDANFTASINISADFPGAPVSNANLLYPITNSVVNKNSNIIPLQFNGYDTSKLITVTLEYQPISSSQLMGYRTAMVFNKRRELTNPLMTNYNWDVSNLPDSSYNIRLKIENVRDGDNFISYSNVASNVVIDRAAPVLFGSPEPAFGTLLVGSNISFTYTQNISPTGIIVTLLDTTTNIPITATANAYGNKVVIAPSINLLRDSNHVIRVVVSNITSVHGNVKPTPDILFFTVSNQTIATVRNNPASPNASVTATPVRGATGGSHFGGINTHGVTDSHKRNGEVSINKSSSDSVAVTFRLSAPVANNQIVNYTVSGDATKGVDYQDLYPDAQNTLYVFNSKTNTYVPFQNKVTGINGISGTIVIQKGDSTATVYIKSLNNPAAITDKVLILTLSPSGNYNIDTAYSATVTMVNNTQIVSGNIITLSGDSIKNVQLQLNGIDSNLVSGSYKLNIPTDSSINIGLYKNNDANPANGITVLDALLVNAHILNKMPLNSPYKLIAADVNEDSMINVSDVLLIKNLILSNSNTFTNTAGKNNLWAFVDSAYQFANPSNPFPYKDSIALNNLSANQPNQTFYGIKLGDVNADWNASIQGLDLPNKPVGLFYKDANLSSDGLLHIPIKVKDFNSIMGMQFTLNFNSDVLQLNSIKNKALKMEVATKQSEKGALSFLWDDASLVSKSLPDSTELFELVFSTKGNIGNPNIKISSDITQIAAYDGNWAKHYITMTTGKLTLPEPSVATESWDVSPNPSTGIVNLSMSLTQGKEIGFELTSIDGKVLSQQKVDALGGKSTKTLNLTHGNKLASGIYYLKASGIDAKSVKTIIIRQ